MTLLPLPGWSRDLATRISRPPAKPLGTFVGQMAQALVDARLLRRSIDDMRQHMADLISPQIRSYPREKIDPETGAVLGIDGMTRHPVPSLLQQLRRAVESSTSRGGGPSKFAPIPISADAHDLLTAITSGATEMVKLWQARPDSATIEDRLRAVVSAAGQSTDLEAVLGIRHALAKWVRAIQTLLDPPKRFYLAAPCPQCDTSMVRRHDQATGEDVQLPALQVDGKEGCHCLACGAHWPPVLFEHLAGVLGCPPVDGVP